MEVKKGREAEGVRDQDHLVHFHALSRHILLLTALHTLSFCLAPRHCVPLRSCTRARRLAHRPVDRLHLWPFLNPALTLGVLGRIERLAHVLWVCGSTQWMDTPAACQLCSLLR